MRKQIDLSFFLSIFLMGFTFLSFGQEQLHIEGAITIENSSTETPEPGTIRFNSVKNDFEGWNGIYWVSLTGGLTYEIGSVSDIDGNDYKTVKIGTQTWMAENLKVTRYNTGSSIVYIDETDHASWIGADFGAYCSFDTTGSGYANYNENVFGKLYNWYAVEGDSLCPSGWQVPSDSDFTTLIDFLDEAPVDPDAGLQSSIAGGKLKNSCMDFWLSPNFGASNISGFNGIPGGNRDAHSGEFLWIGERAYFWSKNSNFLGTGISRYLYYDSAEVRRFNNDTNHGFSIRCLKY